MIRPDPEIVRIACERRAHLGRVVRVVVVDADAALDAVQLEPAHGAREALDGAHGVRERRSRACTSTATAPAALIALCTPGTASCIARALPAVRERERDRAVGADVGHAQVRILRAPERDARSGA